MKKTLLLLLALCLCAGVDAQKTKKKNPPKKAKTYVNTLPSVPADSASYAMGVLQAPSLMQYLQHEKIKHLFFCSSVKSQRVGKKKKEKGSEGNLSPFSM